MQNSKYFAEAVRLPILAGGRSIKNSVSDCSLQFLFFSFFSFLVWTEMEEQPKQKCRSRARKVLWFNPPHSLNVKTNLGKEFLELLEKHFPKGNPLNKFLN
jgi:hypothetical protein